MAVGDGRLSLPTVHRLAFDKDFIFLINSLPSVPTPTLGKEIFYFFIYFFAECLGPGTQQRNFLFFCNYFFAECPSFHSANILIF